MKTQMKTRMQTMTGIHKEFKHQAGYALVWLYRDGTGHDGVLSSGKRMRLYLCYRALVINE